MRFWSDVAARFGKDAFRKFARAVPRKSFDKGIRRRVYSSFDVLAYYLARAMGKEAYEWLESQGHTVRRIPLAPPESDQLSRAQTRAIRGLLLDPNESASDRFDALCCLAGLLKRDKINLYTCARRARSKRLEIAMPAAARLAQAKDHLGITKLRQWLGDRDRALAGVAALTLLFEGLDKRAADVLVRTAEHHDVRFQLSVGHALRLAGDPRADRFAFENVKGCRIRTVQDGFVKVFTVVDGYETANIFCAPHFAPAGHGAHYSDYYVTWVHTDPRWRRRGLARLALAAALNHRRRKTCAATSLHTGTRNVAHSLYRDSGLIDYTVGYTYRRRLHKQPSCRCPRGITVRRLDRGDLPAAAAMINDCNAGRPHPRLRLCQLPDSTVAYGAFEKRKMVGMAVARLRGDEAMLDHVAVRRVSDDEKKEERKRRDLAGQALMAALHRSLLAANIKSVYTDRWAPRGTIDDSFTQSLLRHCGYGIRREEVVELRRINNLRQYLIETAGALEKRLSDSTPFATWSGNVWLDGKRIRACLRFRRGRLMVTGRAPHSPSISICGDETAIERIVMGLATPFEESLQTQVDISPMLNAATTDLLETLFPCVVRQT